MRYRVDEVAVRCGISVDTVRFYQTKGLLPPPERESRVAWYNDDHLARLRRVRDLKSKGFTLMSIRRLLDGELDKADEALVEAVAGAVPGEDESAEEFLTVEELAERIGVSPALIHAIEREQLLVPRIHDGVPQYTSADAAAAAAGLALLETGLPLSELLALAHQHDQAARRTAETAVEMFDEHVAGRSGNRPPPMRRPPPSWWRPSEKCFPPRWRSWRTTSAACCWQLRRPGSRK